MPDAPKRLTTVQRMILTYVGDHQKQDGQPTVIASGHKKTRVGYFPALKVDGIATNAPTLYFLLQYNWLERVHGGELVDVTRAGDTERVFQGSDIRYRLTPAGAAMLKGKNRGKEKADANS